MTKEQRAVTCRNLERIKEITHLQHMRDLYQRQHDLVVSRLK